MEAKTYERPHDVDGVTMAFPGDIVGTLLPLREALPEEFRKGWCSNAWCGLAEEWFYSGLDASKLVAKEGIDKQKALRHIQACLGSFQPKQEHKIGGVGYLMSLWLDPVSLKAVKR